MISTEWMTLGVEKIKTYTGPDGTVGVPYEHPTRYEIRSAPDQDVPWALARKVGETHCGLLRTQDFCYGGQYYQVRARSLWSGQLVTEVNEGDPALITNARPGDHQDATTRDEQIEGSPNWPGIISGGDVGENPDGNVAIFGTGIGSTFTYTSPEFDLGQIGRWHFAVCPWLKYDNHLDTWLETDPTDFWTDDEDWTTGEVDELGDPIPDERGWSDTWEEDAGEDWMGDPDDPPMTYTIESSIHEVAGSTVFEEHRPGVFYGRYGQVRVTVTGSGAAASNIDVSTVTATVSQPIRVTTDGDHGLNDGASVTIFGVGGITDANGTFMVEYISTSSFDLVGTIGDGSSYTSGGVVIMGELLELTRLVTQWALIPDGMPWIDARRYGAKGDGTTLNTVMIQAAIDKVANYGGSEPFGGIVYLGDGNFSIENQLKLKNRVWLMGNTSFSTQITADSTFPTDTPLIEIIGDASPPKVFNSRLVNLAVRAGSISGSTCVFSENCEEQSGLYNVDLSHYRKYGLHLATGASMVDCKNLYIITPDTGADAGIYLDHVNGTVSIESVTVGLQDVVSPEPVDCILVHGGLVNLKHIHVEAHTNGIHVEDNAIVTMQSVTGHSSITNLVRIEPGSSITAIDLQANGSTNIILDENPSPDLAIPSSGTSYMHFYTTSEIWVGNVAIQSLSQSAIVDLEIRDLGGTKDYMATEELAQTLSNKLLTAPVIRAVAQAANLDVQMTTVNQGHADNVAEIPNLSTTGSTRQFLMTALGTGVFQDASALRLVDPEFKRQGQGTPYATFSSADQTGAATLRCPDLGDANTHDMAIVDLDQTFSGANEFTGQTTIDKLNLDDPEDVEIASAVAAITKSYVIIDGEGSASDTLAQITGGVNNMLLVVGVAASVTITFEHATGSTDGSLYMSGDVDVAISDVRKRLMFVRHHDGSNYFWHEIGRL